MSVERSAGAGGAPRSTTVPDGSGNPRANLARVADPPSSGTPRQRDLVGPALRADGLAACARSGRERPAPVPVPVSAAARPAGAARGTTCLVAKLNSCHPDPRLPGPGLV